jgi:CYTH domain-containing protein
MAKEIERKFLVNLAEWKPGSSGVFYRQGYLFTSEKLTVRVRISEEEAILSIKGEDVGFQRNEYEYSIPVQDAEEMLELYCEGFIIEKTRYIELINGKRWKLMYFMEKMKGLFWQKLNWNQ